MGKLIRLALPLVVIVIAVMLSQWLKDNSPQAQRRGAGKAVPLSVQTLPLQPQNYQAQVQSYGSIQAHTEANIIAQVGGTITYLADSFREGGFFEKGEVLLRIDPRDYQNAITIAEADLLSTQQLLREEQAKVEQALRDWERLGKGRPANDLVLRKPQLAASQAAVASAKAKLAQARLDLERTTLIAPYAGRVLSKDVELGEYISAGSKLAQTFAVDYLELRLPISLNEQAVLELPESYRRQADDNKPLARVEINSRFGQNSYQWQGLLMRTEAALDSDSRQLYVVAQIDDPYGPANANKPPLKIGQFVSASIQGKQLESVYVVPRTNLYAGNQVVLLIDGKLQRREVRVIWQDTEHYVVDQGLNEGELLVVTPLGQVVSGTPAQAAPANQEGS